MARPIYIRRHIRPHRPEPSLLTDTDEPTVMQSVHSTHFLDRTLRISGPELERAMRLYHHPAVLRRTLADHLPDEGPEARVAIALQEEGPQAHVIVTREGRFVTCLAPGMRVRGVPVLPYGQVQAALERAEALLALAVVRRSQLGRLPLEALVRTLLNGPGHLTREMVEVVEIEPTTYAMAGGVVLDSLIKSLIHIYKAEDRVWRRRPLLRHPLWRCHRKLQGKFEQCLYLLGATGTPGVAGALTTLVRVPNHYFSQAAMALARHPGGAEALVAVGADKDAAPLGRDWAIHTLGYHVNWHPESLPRVAELLTEKPPLSDRWLPHYFEKRGNRYVSKLTPAEYERRLPGPLAKWPLSQKGGDSTWLFSAHELQVMAMHRRPLSELFPPQEICSQVRGAYQRWVHQPPPPEERKKGTPVVRTEARVGRNDPCPCESGSKYKRCCEGKPKAQAEDRQHAALEAEQEVLEADETEASQAEADEAEADEAQEVEECEQAEAQEAAAAHGG